MDLTKQMFMAVATRSADEIARLLVESDLPHFAFKDDAWFIVYAGTARQLADKIGLRGNGEIGAGLIAPITNYSGRGSPELWEWLKVNWPSDG